VTWWAPLASVACAVIAGCAGEAPPASVVTFVESAPKGSVPVVVFIDFECSFCKAAHERLHSAANSQHATLAIEYRHVPLHSHEHATEAASAQVCAAEQDRGEDAVAALFAAGTAGHDLEHLLEMARALGLDEERFTKCMTSDSTRGRLASDRHVFIEAQFDGVPVMFVGTQKLDGTHPLADYAKAIQDAQNR
jgi:predicted DsbA family dithiol-disulfide isomerase